MNYKFLIFILLLSHTAKAQEFVNVLNLGIKNDSTLVSTAAGNALQAQLDAGDKTIYFPRGTYHFNRRGTDGLGFEYIFTVTDPNIRIWLAPGAKIYFPTSNTQGNTFGHFFLLKAGTENFTLQGGNFYSTSQDSTFETGYYSAVYASLAYNVRVENVNFYDVTPVVFISGVSRDFIFENCIVRNAPSSLVPCDNSVISRNKFIHDYFYDGGTHDIYSYGRYGRVEVSNNYFEKAGGYGIKIRASTAQYEAKTDFIITNNKAYDMPDGLIDFGTNEEVNHINIVFTGNTCTNCQRVQLYNPQSAYISGNMWRIDVFSRSDISYGGISFASNLTDTNGATSLPRDFIISNNIIENTAKRVSKIIFNSNPSIDDTLRIGEITYYIVASPVKNDEIERGATLSLTLTNIWQKLRDTKNNGGLVRRYVEQHEQIIRNTATSELILNLNDSVTITTNLPVTFNEFQVNYKNRLLTGIEINGTFRGAVVTNNIVNGAVLPFSLTNNRFLLFNNNTVNGFYGTQIISASSNIQPVYTNNRYYPTELSSVYRSDIKDYMPVFKDNVGFPLISFASDYKEIAFSNVQTLNAGVGVASNYLYYGKNQTVTPTLQTKLYHWTEGDSVKLYDGSSLLYSFIYVQSSPGLNEFSSKTELVALIDATPEFEAVDLKVSDTQGIIRIDAASGGTAGNDYRLQTVTDSYFNGLYLQENFVGGSANPDVTVFWTTEATNYTVPTVTPINSGATSLMGVYVDIANSVPGKYYLIKHSNAAGTEQFLIKM